MILLVDNYDSFTYNLVHLFQELGAEVVVERNDAIDADEAERLRPSHLVVSPGPGRPEDFGISKTIGTALDNKLPIFGVCLGVQAIGEYFGGQLGQLGQPAHGRPSRIQVRGGRLMQNLPNEIVIGRYHSLAATSVPDALEVSATSDDGEVMGVRHRELRVDGVQFHPESVLTLPLGIELCRNFLEGRS